MSGIKSKPVYAPLIAVPEAPEHLLLGTAPGAGALARVLAGLPSGRRVSILYAGDGAPTPPAGSSDVVVESVPDVDALVARLAERLAVAHMGLRVYVAGPEQFIGRCVQVGLAHDLRADELQREHCGTGMRRVYCVHCTEVFEGVTTSLAACPGCGRQLVVRDHYSRRLAAYMGVMADAEVPGELPPVEELFR